MSVVEVQGISRLSFAQRLRAHIDIARFDRSIDNLFVIPGIVIPLIAMPGRLDHHILIRLALAALAVTLAACSNCVLSEVLDAPADRLHPIKRNRPAALGLIVPWVAYAQWLAMATAGVGIGFLVSQRFAVAAIALWVMGCIFNIPPVRAKNVPFLDVLIESASNPLRVLLGWYAVTSVLAPPVSLLLCCWMISCYFVALRRFSKLSESMNRKNTGAYQASFGHYKPEWLLASSLFYACAGMLFMGAFIMLFRIELILAFPLVAFSMAVFCKRAFKASAAAQKPVKFYYEPLLVISLSATVLVLAILLFVRIPQLEHLIKSPLPQTGTHGVASSLSSN
jgi:decaprenyl-phosphate phosphoribosyltransferase